MGVKPWSLRMGFTHHSRFEEKNPFRKDGCTFEDKDCMVNAKTDCSKQNVTYIVTCHGCPNSVTFGPNLKTIPNHTEAGGEHRYNFIGMIGTSMHARAKIHAQAITDKNMSNALSKHVQITHGGIDPGFTMDICMSHTTVMNRYKTEAIYIENQMLCTYLNDRLEGGCGGLIRIDSRIERM